MDNELLDMLDKIISDLNDSSEAKELVELKEKILKDKVLLDSINKLQKMDKNDKDYMTLKSKIFENEDYKRAHPSQGNKLGKFMKEITNLLKLVNNFGKIIIGIMALYFLHFLGKNCTKKD